MPSPPVWAVSDRIYRGGAVVTSGEAKSYFDRSWVSWRSAFAPWTSQQGSVSQLVAVITGAGADDIKTDCFLCTPGVFGAPIIVRWAAKRRAVRHHYATLLTPAEQRQLEQVLEANPHMAVKSEQRWLEDVVIPFLRVLANAAVCRAQASKSYPGTPPTRPALRLVFLNILQKQCFRCALCGCRLTFYLAWKKLLRFEDVKKSATTTIWVDCRRGE